MAPFLLPEKNKKESEKLYLGVKEGTISPI